MPEPKSTTHRRDPDKTRVKNTSFENDSNSEDALMHPMNENNASSRGKNSGSFLSSKLFVIVVIAALFGVATGYFLAQNGGKTGIATLDKASSSAKIQKGAIFGSDDLKTFKDTAEGEVKKGGIEDEGSHSLIRPGGDSQTVCMTSSHVDFDALQGRKVKVWGQTNTANTCGWLMDVGRVEVLN